MIELGLTAAGLSLLVRLLAKHWTPKLFARRPLSCPTCSAFWAAGLLTVWHYAPWLSGTVLLNLGGVWLGAGAIAAVINTYVLPGPPDVPEFPKEWN